MSLLGQPFCRPYLTDRLSQTSIRIRKCCRLFAIKDLKVVRAGVEPATHGFSAKEMEPAFSQDLPGISSILGPKTGNFNPFHLPSFSSGFRRYLRAKTVQKR
jgi:hypothetical protein